MNKKIGYIFFVVVATMSYSYSQQSPDETEYDEDFSADAFDMNHDEQPEPNHLKDINDDELNGHDEQHSPNQLQKIATDEANKDLVGLLDTLESGSKKHDVSFDQHDENASTKTENISTEMSKETEEPAIEGIDTVDLEQPQGNWLFKRIWWERSEARYEKIKKKIEEIFENRMVFFEKRSELIKNILDPFYLKIGMGQGELQAILTDRIQTLEKEREKKGTLTAQERDMLAILEKERETLEQLMMDVQAIGDIESRVDESLSLLLEQMRAIRSYDMQAWDAFKEIARVVDDEKARQLYYVVETSWRNIKDIGDYLGHSFAAHFDQLMFTAQEQTARVSQVLAALKEKGIDFKKQVEQIMEPTLVEKIEKEAVEEEEEPEEQGFFSSYILNPLSAAWNGIVSVVTWPYYALFGSKEEEPEQEEE